MRILLAEDERDLQEVVVAYLEYQGYHVTAVDNGAQAVEKANTDAYDAIVMDIMMPVMDGIAAMKRIRAAGNTVPAIFLTAKAEVSDRIEGLDAGADDYLTKPFAMEELSARLRALNRRRRDYKVRTLSFSNLELDTEASELRAHNTIGLALKEVRLLSCLMSNADRAMTAEELLTEVWPGEDASVDSVWMYISFLNAKLQSVQASATIDGDREHAEGKDVDTSRFFERFYRQDESHNSEKSGFGIGLSMAKEIADRMKGKLRVKYSGDTISFTVEV